MTIQYSVSVRNEKLDAVEAAIGTSPILKIYTGSMPASCSSARTGTVLATVTLPVDWMNSASSGVKTKTGTWEDPSADNTGIAGYFSILDSTGTTTHIQGTVGLSGADMILDSVNFTAGQAFTVTNFQITAGNA